MSSRTKDMAIRIKDRIMENEEHVIIVEHSKEEAIERYKYLKDRLVFNFQKEIHNKIENMKILKEIKDNKYYKLDGYNNFEEFTRNYRLAKSQAYDYLRIANALDEKIVEESYIVQNGIQNVLLFLRNKEGFNIRKSSRNVIKPLRFQLKTEQAYIYYKSKAKFTSFLLENLLKYEKILLDKYESEYILSKK
ncbi:chromosome replication/partitioning protein [Borrelia miyamotoi]|uniref:Chromosome replication/partitioning protein n=1 Tax=Borrelia miyamotoi TaxID=47466 RepID=A0AAQ2WZM6_9SPIR|nr:chromosome replication/partitioning protein [Borrelia miyamotoi]AOW96258.1 permease [Borrelia miyamotoi]QTL84350.1 chromosome replication/partitioning protein [Borrelia miyamotoi]WAZ86022.1 chromosome replication/partitioning protein [Borrelia miyamotoi]WAZ91805.1 chromosome replication/partitioning protein [Borrelia miyamotoi]WAZ93098.1 chromosome replication/partitioning protein [Borrelia miyamotoi]